MRALVFSLLLVATAARLPDACARLDMPVCQALRDECDAAVQQRYGVSVEWYIERNEHAKLNASRTLPEACGDEARAVECAAELTARTDVALNELDALVAKYTREAQHYHDHTVRELNYITEGTPARVAYTLLHVFSLVYAFYFLYTHSRPRRS